jgi:hypothetical protein
MDLETTIRHLAAEHTELVHVLVAMCALGTEGSMRDGVGEFDYPAVRSRAGDLPIKTLRVFSAAGLIEPSRRGKGSRRNYYELCDQAAVERVLRTLDMEPEKLPLLPNCL